jgi:sporulation protein YlmC with PRC-barrel domain
MKHTKKPFVLSAGTLTGTPIRNSAGEDLGKIEELMIDLEEGRISYAVVSFGGFLGINTKYFAIPWGLLAVDTDQKCVILDIEKEVLENAPGFDKNDWPDLPTREWLANIYLYYEYPRYW